MGSPQGPSSSQWITRYCPELSGQYLFIDPILWETHLISAGSKHVLAEASSASDSGTFDSFLLEIAGLGGWPRDLEYLARSVAILTDKAAGCYIG